jgi:predicted membrane-bound spermidine synthase
MPILLFFFFSGATALIYEVVWSKYLSLILGSTIQAQTVVLAAFMCGLALGNRLFGRWADRLARPLVAYAYVEGFIGVYALLFAYLYKAADGIFASAGSHLLGHSAPLLLLKASLSVGLLLCPTILMGGTLPLMAAWLKKSTTDAARRTALFYAVNSLGAVFGAGLAGFVLVQNVGMHATINIAAVGNLLICAGILVLTKAFGVHFQSTEIDDGAGQPATEAAPELKASPSSIFWYSCVLVALSGGISMALEVLASRCLALIFGASLQVFAIVLMAFILGIGIGSSIIARPRVRRWHPELTTILLALGTAFLLGALVLNIETLVEAYAYLQTGLSRTLLGYHFHELMMTGIALCVLGVPAAALGSILPLRIRMLSDSPDLLGTRVGRLLTWNTIGAMLGSLIAAFVLMPHVGLRGSFTVLGLVLVALAAASAWLTHRRILLVVSLGVGVFLCAIALDGGQKWRYILSSGIFREKFESFAKNWMQDRLKTTDLLFYEDAADATVSVEQGPSPFSTNEITLRINGKADASSTGDMSTQVLLAQLPLMAKPDSKDVFCFGVGSGVTAGSTLGYPIEHLTIADNCEPVLRAVKFFEPWNHGVMTNDRTRLYREDARTVLKLSPQKYDVIISEPSNPWTVGIGSVFSRDFYQLISTRLKPGGIMAQWFHIYEIDDEVLHVVLRTFSSVFPNMEIWDMDGGDIVLLGSDRPWPSGIEQYRHAFELAGPRRDLEAIGLMTPDALLARQLASQRTAFAVPPPGRLQTDNLPYLEYQAPKAFYVHLGETVHTLDPFDERTWQLDMAAPEKNRLLGRLSPQDQTAIFSRFSSVNTELMSYVRMQVDPSSATSGLRSMPCVFRGPVEPLVYAPEVARTNTTVRKLVEDELTFRGNSEDSIKAAIITTKQILDATKRYEPEVENWRADYYAGLAVKACLRVGQKEDAKQILARGLQLEPLSPQLNYLSRILDREAGKGNQPNAVAAAN